MSSTKKALMCMILAVLGILLSNNAMAGQQLTLSDLRFTRLDGTLMVPDELGVVGPIGPTEEFYIYFDVFNSGDGLVTDMKLSVSSSTGYIYEALENTKFTLDPGGTIDDARMRVRFVSSTCPGTKDIVISGVVGDKTGKISYDGGPDCANLEVTRFAWLPKDPAEVWADSSMTDKKYGFSFTLKNNEPLASFSGTYTLTGYNYGNIATQTNTVISQNTCTKTGTIALSPAGQPGDTVELKIDPSDDPSSPEYCPVRAIGYIFIYVKTPGGASVTPANGQYRRYLAPILMWGGDYAPYIEKSGYASGEVVNVYDTEGIPNVPALPPIPAGSTYNIIVKNKVTDEVIYQASKPINEQLAPGRKFGTDPSYEGTSIYYLGPTYFPFPSSAPESLAIMTQLRDSSGNIIFCMRSLGGSIPGYGYRTHYIDLMPLILCNTTKTTGNPGCTCSISIGSTYDVTCTLKHSGTVAKKYIGRFIFNSTLEEDLKNEYARTNKRLISITTTPTETITPVIGNSIEFTTVPKPSPDPNPDRTYLFSFECDLDGDGYASPICGGDEDDCDDSNANRYPGLPEDCTDSLDNDCNGLVDCNDDACKSLETCQIGVRATLNHFYGQGIMDTTSAPRTSNYCEGDDGNFYEYDIPYSEIGWNDCGPAKITIPVEGTKITENTVNIEWTRQSSIFPLTYYLEYSGHPWDESMAWTGMASFADPTDLAYVWDVTDVPDGEYTIKLTPNDGYVNGTINETWIIISRVGDIRGKVECCDEAGNCVPVANANVSAGGRSTLADKDGNYLLTEVPRGPQTVIASNMGNTSQRKSVEVISMQTTVGINFDSVCPIIIDCNPDCTVVGTEAEPYPLCDPRCEGINGCSITQGCEYVSKGTKIEVMVDDTPMLVTCCIGLPESLPEEEGKPKLDIDANNIARTTRIVYYKGKPVKMVVVTWD